ncbi:MAG: anthranilate phosphoribosyltransferase, partial [Pseudomonadota bacterium]
FAPAHHAAMKHVGPARVELGTRTVFNLLGPLSNPASVRRQLVGVFSKAWVRPVADVLAALGTERALIVHGADGLDEMTTTTITHVASVEEGVVTEYDVDANELGLARADPASLTGADAQHNAAALRAVLAGEAGPYRDIAALNAAGALLVAGHVETLAEGLAEATRVIDAGLATKRLEALIAVADAVAP